jgi:hypothetical protein
MRIGWFLMMPALAVWLACCGSAPQQGQFALPAVAPNKARLVFYRSPALSYTPDPYNGPAWTSVSLNGRDVGTAAPGTVFYRDVAPGEYYIAVRSEGPYPDQFKTVVVQPGNVLFVKIILGWGLGSSNAKTFVVAIVDPTIARDEIGRLQFVPG